MTRDQLPGIFPPSAEREFWQRRTINRVGPQSGFHHNGLPCKTPGEHLSYLHTAHVPLWDNNGHHDWPVLWQPLEGHWVWPGVTGSYSGSLQHHSMSPVAGSWTTGEQKQQDLRLPHEWQKTNQQDLEKGRVTITNRHMVRSKHCDPICMEELQLRFITINTDMFKSCCPPGGKPFPLVSHSSPELTIACQHEDKAVQPTHQPTRHPVHQRSTPGVLRQPSFRSQPLPTSHAHPTFIHAGL